jgi:CHASE3 domain sensor protein
VIHTYQVLEILDQLQTSIIEAETTERGYILTGEVSFLQSHDSADK